MEEAIQQKEAAQQAAELVEKERDKAVRQKIAAEEAVSLAQSEEISELIAVAEVAQDQLVAEERAMILEAARTQPLLKAIVTGELRYFIEPLPYFAGKGVQQAVDEVAKSFSSWSRYGAEIIRVHNLQDADLTIEWIRDYGSHVLGQAIYSSHIKVGLGTSNCLGEWKAFDADTIKKILWHELGHSMGYGHSRDSNNVMHEKTETRFVVEQEVSEMLGGGWYYYFPLCGSGEYHYSFETEDTAQGFDVYVLAPDTDPKSFTENGGKVYVDCGAEGMHRFSGTCNVAQGAIMFLSNSSLWNVIRLDGTIVNSKDIAWPEMTWDEAVFQYDDSELREYYELFR